MAVEVEQHDPTKGYAKACQHHQARRAAGRIVSGASGEGRRFTRSETPSRGLRAWGFYRPGRGGIVSVPLTEEPETGHFLDVSRFADVASFVLDGIGRDPGSNIDATVAIVTPRLLYGFAHSHLCLAGVFCSCLPAEVRVTTVLAVSRHLERLRFFAAF